MPVKPSDKEEEYFAKEEIQRRLKAQAEKTLRLAEEEKQRLRELHYLHCPKCGNKLEEAVIREVTVDMCPGCHGIFLDAGELEKITAMPKGLFATIQEVFR